MLDHVTQNRFEWGTGRGAGSHEMRSFNILDKDSTKPEWNEVVREIPRMWEQRDYTFEGESFTVPTPHNILPKPYGKGHPPIWVACGNPGTFVQAGEMGIGAIAFNFEPVFSLKGRIDSYKEGVANCTEPIGQFKNDNVMITNAVICMSDRDRARRDRPAPLPRLPLLAGLPLPRHHAEAGLRARPGPTPIPGVGDYDNLDRLIEDGWLLCGKPDEVAEQLARYQTVGCDQLVFGLPSDSMEHEEVLEMLEVFGTKVIPEFDKDQVHSTTRYRATAQRKYPDFAVRRAGHRGRRTCRPTPSSSWTAPASCRPRGRGPRRGPPATSDQRSVVVQAASRSSVVVRW